MELTELSLATTHSAVVGKSASINSPSSEYEGSSCRKRKVFSDHRPVTTGPSSVVDLLQRKDPLPLDWEQCLDLESGRMYYLNRKTLRKSWNWPKNQKLDLELNISNCSGQCKSSNSLEDMNKTHENSSSNNMVALACLNCHLLVILSKSSPSCPNCKFAHSLSTLQTHQPPPPKSLNTLSLMN